MSVEKTRIFKEIIACGLSLFRWSYNFFLSLMFYASLFLLKNTPEFRKDRNGWKSDGEKRNEIRPSESQRRRSRNFIVINAFCWRENSVPRVRVYHAHTLLFLHSLSGLFRSKVIKFGKILHISPLLRLFLACELAFPVEQFRKSYVFSVALSTFCQFCRVYYCYWYFLIAGKIASSSRSFYYFILSFNLRLCLSCTYRRVFIHNLRHREYVSMHMP